MHNAAFEALSLNYVYVAFHVEDVSACLAGMRAFRSFRGMSVTIPHKMAVMPHLDTIDPMAAKVGSVNTIVNDGGSLSGSTTDGLGALEAFADAQVILRQKQVLFLGAGGAVRSVAFAVADMPEPPEITVIARNRDRVAALVGDLREKTGATVHSGDFGRNLAEAMKTHDVVVQGTPVGMYPHPDESCVPKELWRPEHVVFDMVYRPLKTRLIQDAEAAGCTTIPGVEMLVNQAALQFEKWTAQPAPRTVMREALLTELAKG